MEETTRTICIITLLCAVMMTPAAAADLEFGDAPDPTYPSLLASNGARHIPTETECLGLSQISGDWKDFEANARVPDMDIAFDDGLRTFAVVTNNTNQTVDFEVTNTIPDNDLIVNILLDLNGDGDWNDTVNNQSEHVVQNQAINLPGSAEAVFTSTPFSTVGATPGQTWMRVTLTRSPIYPDWDGTMASAGYVDDPFGCGETEDWNISIEEEEPEPYLEFGDALDPTYPSLLASDGARHFPTDTECLGLWYSTGDWKDFELDARITDLDTPYDDGLVTNTIAAGNPTQTVTFEVSELAGSPTLIVNILIDLNIDGDWNDPGEHVVVNQNVPIAGVEAVVDSTPFSTVGAVPGPTWMRVTLTRSPINPDWDGTMSGFAQMIPFEYGETEDWRVDIEEYVEDLEFGDAPDNSSDPTDYPSLLASDGARHFPTDTECLGLNSTGDWKDFEPNARITDLDTPYDDGLLTCTLMANNPAQTVRFEVTERTGTPDLIANILVDLNGDNDWNDAGEHVVVNQPISIAGGEGVVTSNQFSTIGAVPGPTWMRITLTRSNITPSWNGTMTNSAAMIPFACGETEDWDIYIEGEPSEDLEFGDAPDNSSDPADYPSLLASDGARHIPTTTECLGLQSTGEWKNYELDANVPGMDPFDDGSLTFGLITNNPAQTVSFEVSELMGSQTLIANILVDLNIDGDWNDPGEHVVVNQPILIVSGEGVVVSNAFSTIGAVPGWTWMRVTLTRSPINLGWDGTMGGFAAMIPFEYGETEDWNIWMEEEEPSEPYLEFGDAPDNSSDPTDYPSLLASDGARHTPTYTECLGLWYSNGDWKDYELDANVPDMDLLDDGLVSGNIVTNSPTQTVTFEVSELMGSQTLIANILIDLNIDGDWSDPGEHVVVNQPIPIAGGEAVVVSNLFSTMGATPGTTWMRVTLTRSQITPGWDGTMASAGPLYLFEYGETEDFEISIKEEISDIEFGDAPDPLYPSLLASDGARHFPTVTECLGLNSTGDWKDFELDANVPDLDLYDDGLPNTTMTTNNSAQTVTFEVTELTGVADLMANILIDLNADGDWDETGEHVVVNQPISIASGEGTVASNLFSTVGAARGTTWMRIALTRQPVIQGWNGTMASAGYPGPFDCGETEDHEIKFVVCGDVTGDGVVNMGDVTKLLWNQTYWGQYPVDPCAADVTGGGGVNMGDVTKLLWNQTYWGQYPLTCPC